MLKEHKKIDVASKVAAYEARRKEQVDIRTDVKALKTKAKL